MVRHIGAYIVIEVGYTTTAGDDTVSGTYDTPAEANAAVATLKTSLASRNDIAALFMQVDSGEGMQKYGFIDPD